MATKPLGQEDLFAFHEESAPSTRSRSSLTLLAERARLAVRQTACQAYAFQPTPSEPRVDPFSYDHIIVAFSGGKDSLAMVLLLLELGIPLDRIELWHHDIDGREGSTLMDWACTRDYCIKVAAALGLRLYFSWKVGGFEGEMLRENAPTAAYKFETPTGLQTTGGESNKTNTRRMFPQKSPNLAVRWCSAYGKIMVMEAAIRQPRFTNKRTLVLTGERAEESASRAKYEIFERHRADLREGRKPRLIDVWRPVHGWKSGEIWALIEKHRVVSHPGYRLGWGRLSCAACIFGSPNQWASLRAVNPRQFGRIDAYEREFGKTIDRTRTVLEMADRGTPFPNMREEDIRAALSETFDEPVFMDPWVMPAGAHGDACGPT